MVCAQARSSGHRGRRSGRVRRPVERCAELVAHGIDTRNRVRLPVIGSSSRGRPHLRDELIQRPGNRPCRLDRRVHRERRFSILHPPLPTAACEPRLGEPMRKSPTPAATTRRRSRLLQRDDAQGISSSRPCSIASSSCRKSPEVIPENRPGNHGDRDHFEINRIVSSPPTPRSPARCYYRSVRSRPQKSVR